MTRGFSLLKGESIVATNIHALIANSGQTLEATAIRCSSLLYRTALRRVRNHADAEDAVQDAWLSACRHIHQFEGRAQFSTWMTRIVFNAAGSQLRRKSRHVVVSLDQKSDQEELSLGDQLVHNGPGPEDIYKETELRAVVSGLLKGVSPLLRDAFQLVDLEGRSIREAACVLGIQESALKSRLVRVRTRLAAAFRQAPRRAAITNPTLTGRGGLSQSESKDFAGYGPSRAA
jgi:RNA polymerase sigma-70 factor (ECF subfamily)